MTQLARFTFTVTFTIPLDEARQLDESFREHGKKTLASLDLNRPILLTWDYKETRK